MYQWAFDKAMARLENDERTEEEKQAAEELDAKLATQSEPSWQHEKVNYTLGYLVTRLAAQLARVQKNDKISSARHRREALFTLQSIITAEFGERAGEYFWEVYDEIWE